MSPEYAFVSYLGGLWGGCGGFNVSPGRSEDPRPDLLTRTRQQTIKYRETGPGIGLRRALGGTGRASKPGHSSPGHSTPDVLDGFLNPLAVEVDVLFRCLDTAVTDHPGDEE